MKAIDITEDTLEDLLSYDDHFLDYFNAFLQLPVFSEPLEYDRLTGTFREAQTTAGGRHAPTSGKRYGVSDVQRESMLEWCKSTRLPFFLETDLFRELKLLKLLLRKLEDRYQSSASHKSSSAIRGYSRQSESYVSSLSNSADNSANEDDYDEDDWTERDGDMGMEDEPGGRPVSRATSLPAGHIPGQADFIRPMSPRKQPSRDKKVIFAHKDHAGSLPDSSGAGVLTAALPDSIGQPASVSRQPTFASIEENQVLEAQPPSEGASVPSNSRSISAPVNYRDFLKLPGYMVFSELFLGYEPALNEEYIAYADEKTSEQQTESDVKNLEGKVNMSLHQMKERILSTMSGMREFKEFLQSDGCSGIHLLNFWLDCERFKDTHADDDELEKMAARNRLFRDIQDKYKMSLTSDAKEQIRKASSCYHLGYNVFIRTQYDVLRRIRSYWLPRFILHKEKSNDLSTLICPPAAQPPDATDDISTSFLPRISFVASLPIRHEHIMALTSTGSSWADISQAGKKLDTRIKSAGAFRFYQSDFSDRLQDRMIHSLLHDGQAGGPFQAYLVKFEKRELLNKLLFWQAVANYSQSEERQGDRLLRMNLSWAIYNQHIHPNAPQNIGIDTQTHDEVHDSLINSTDFLSVSVFDAAKLKCEMGLLGPWMLFVKHDVKMYLDAQAAQFHDMEERPVFTLDSIHLYCDPKSERIAVSKPLLQPRMPSASTMTTVKVIKKDSLTKSARGRRRIAIQERRKELLKEQRALLKEVRLRQEQSKQRVVDLNAKSRASHGVDGQVDAIDGLEDHIYGPSSGKSRSNMSRFSGLVDGRKSSPMKVDEQKEVELIDMIANRPMMSLFKRYLAEHDRREFVNGLLLYNEIEVYHRTETKPKTKKELQAHFLYKTYMDKSSKKAVTLSEKIYGRLANEKDRPKSVTLQETQRHLLSYISPMFKQFFEAQAEEFGIEPKQLATMSQAELSMRSEAESSLAKLSKDKKGGGRGKKEEDGEGDHVVAIKTRKKRQLGRAPPSKEDKISLMQNLQETQHSGKMTTSLRHFWKYLVKHGDEENSPLIDKDLLFYIEVMKYKDLGHSHNDEEIVRKKCQAIIDVFLESSISPPCQIDISSDMCSRIVKSAVKVMQGKEIVPNVFDEAVFLVFKEILPYWAGFMKQYRPPTDPSVPPISKHQKALQERYVEFLKWQPPPAEKITLPFIKAGLNQAQIKVSSLTYSIVDGLRVRANDTEDYYEYPSEEKVTKVTSMGKRKASVAASISSKQEVAHLPELMSTS